MEPTLWLNLKNCSSFGKTVPQPGGKRHRRIRLAARSTGASRYSKSCSRYRRRSPANAADGVSSCRIITRLVFSGFADGVIIQRQQVRRSRISASTPISSHTSVAQWTHAVGDHRHFLPFAGERAFADLHGVVIVGHRGGDAAVKSLCSKTKPGWVFEAGQQQVLGVFWVDG